VKQLRKRLTYANVMSSLAVFMVLGGASAFAATQLAKESVGTNQLKKEAVSLAKIKLGTKNALKGQTGPQGPQGKQGERGLQGQRGEKGEKGAQGLQGIPGVSGLERVTQLVATSAVSPKSVVVTCPDGKKVISTGFDIDGGSSGVSPNTVKEAAIDAVNINGAMTAVTFEAYNQKGAGAPNWSLRGIITCANVG